MSYGLEDGFFVETTIQAIVKVGNGKCSAHFRWCRFLRSAVLWQKQLENSYLVFVITVCFVKTKAMKLRRIRTKWFYDLNFIRVNAQERFYKNFVALPNRNETKIIGEEFIRVFEDKRRKSVPLILSAELLSGCYRKRTRQEPQSSHHNVGGLLIVLISKIIEPLRMLFKDEVRRSELGTENSYRQPFLTGTCIRIGEVTEEKVHRSGCGLYLS